MTDFLKIAIMCEFFLIIKIIKADTSIKYSGRFSSEVSENVSPPELRYSFGQIVWLPHIIVPIVSYPLNFSANSWEKSPSDMNIYDKYPSVAEKRDPEKGKSDQTNSVAETTKSSVEDYEERRYDPNLGKSNQTKSVTNTTESPADDYKEEGYDPETDCGTAIIIEDRLATPFATSVNRSQLQDHPWYAAIYFHDVTTNQIDFICGGTLISLYSVLTAAHCISTLDRKGKLMCESEKFYKVAVGKYFTNFSEIEEQAQIKDVEHIHLSEFYSLPRSAGLFDLAILELKSPIMYGEFSIPACIDMKNEHKLDHYVTKGEVVSFGNDENGTSPTNLQKASVLYFDRDLCFDRLPGDFTGYELPKDKFCSIVDKGYPTIFQQGDSGTGIIFKFSKTEPNDERKQLSLSLTAPYVYGVVSGQFINTTVVSITDLRIHLNFIKSTLKIIARNHKKNVW